VLVEEDVFELQVSVYAGQLVDVADCADELGEGLLGLFDRQLSMLEEVVVELVTCKVSERASCSQAYLSYQGSIPEPTTQGSQLRSPRRVGRCEGGQIGDDDVSLVRDSSRPSWRT
jgi:hypothetical protein